MIQFLKGYYHEKSGRKFRIGDKVTIWNEDDLVDQGIAVKTTAHGKKMITEFFKPKK